MWAVLLGVLLVLVAATSSHAAVRTISAPRVTARGAANAQAPNEGHATARAVSAARRPARGAANG